VAGHSGDAPGTAETTRLRVRYAETDAMGVVYYGHFLTYFEVGRVEYLIRRGVSYGAMEAAGIFMPVTEASCRYRAPAHFEEELAVETSVGAAGRARVRFDYVVRRGAEVVAEGYTWHAARRRDGRPARIPPAWAAQLGFPPVR
jgi:acyl-CoA thioester hydrolase